MDSNEDTLNNPDPQQQPEPSTFWSRWLRPNIKAVTLNDWHFWVSCGIFLVLAAFPLIKRIPHIPLRVATYESDATIADIASMTTAIASIQAAVAVALGTIILALPPGKFLDAINSVDPSTNRTPILDLAFLSFWAGISAIASAVTSVIAAIFIGGSSAVSTAGLTLSISSAICIAVAAHALLQLFALLTALLELVGIQHAFNVSKS